MLSSSSALFAYSPPAGKPEVVRLCDAIEGCGVWYDPITKSTLDFDLRKHLTEAKANATETTTILCIGGQLRGFDALVIDHLEDRTPR